MPREVTQYGQCDHPMIQQRDGGWYCTECGVRRS